MPEIKRFLIFTFFERRKVESEKQEAKMKIESLSKKKMKTKAIAKNKQ